MVVLKSEGKLAVDFVKRVGRFCKIENIFFETQKNIKRWSTPLLYGWVVGNVEITNGNSSLDIKTKIVYLWRPQKNARRNVCDFYTNLNFKCPYIYI